MSGNSYNQQSLSSLSSIGGSGYYSGGSNQYGGGSGYYSVGGGSSNQYGSTSGYFGQSMSSQHHLTNKPIRPSFKTPEGHYKLIKESNQPKQPARRFKITPSKISFFHQQQQNNSNNLINNNNNNNTSKSINIHNSSNNVTTNTPSSSLTIPISINNNSIGNKNTIINSYTSTGSPSSYSENSYSSSPSNNSNNNNSGSNYNNNNNNNNNNNKNRPMIQTIDKELLYFGFLTLDTFICYQFTNIDKAEFEERGGPVGLHNNSPTCLKMCKKRTASNNRLQIIVGTDSGEIYYFDPIQEKPNLVFNKDIYRSKCNCLEWLPNSSSQFIVGFANGNLLVFDVTRTDNNIPPPTYSDHNSNPQSSLNYNTILLNGEEFYVKTQKNLKYNPVSEWKVSKKPINSICFSPDGKFLAVACQDGYLHIYNFETKVSIVSFKSYFGGFLSVDWSQDSKYLVSGSEDDYISIWSFEELELIARGQGHQSWVSSIKFDPFVYTPDTPDYQNKYRILSGGEDTRLLLWEFSRDNLKKPKVKSNNTNNNNTKNEQQQQQQQKDNEIENEKDSSEKESSESSDDYQSTSSNQDLDDDDYSNSNNSNTYSINNQTSNHSYYSGGENIVNSKPRSEVPIILPIVSHRVGSEPVSDLIFTKDWIVTVSNSKFSIWARPTAVANTQKIDSLCSPNTPHSYTKQYMMDNNW